MDSTNTVQSLFCTERNATFCWEWGVESVVSGLWPGRHPKAWYVHRLPALIWEFIGQACTENGRAQCPWGPKLKDERTEL